jgi:general secretion pathway protein G
MVVIVILGLLATIMVINVMPAADRASAAAARADIATLEQGVQLFRLERRRYPTSEEGLQKLVEAGQVQRLRQDPWGHPYRYVAPGRDGRPFDIFSTGADGREGGEGDDADIGTWSE